MEFLFHFLIALPIQMVLSAIIYWFIQRWIITRHVLETGILQAEIIKWKRKFALIDRSPETLFGLRNLIISQENIIECFIKEDENFIGSLSIYVCSESVLDLYQRCHLVNLVNDRKPATVHFNYCFTDLNFLNQFLNAEELYLDELEAIKDGE